MIFNPNSIPLDITFLVLADSSLMTVASSLEPLRAANRICGRELYRWQFVSSTHEPPQMTCGLPLATSGRFDPNQCGDVLIIIAGFNVLIHANPNLLSRVRRASRSSKRFIGGMESGSWVLAQAGLLNGRKATTHWEDFEDFSNRFPKVKMRTDRYVIDGRFFTTGGASPSFDFMLHLVRCRQGYTAALDVASVFIYDQSHAAADAQPLVSLGDLNRQEPRVAKAIQLMEEHFEAPMRIVEIAKIIGVSTKTLEILFRTNVEMTPGAYYLSLRLSAVRRLLLDTRVSMTDIAIRTGFSSNAALSRAFRNHFGKSPQQFRRAFP